MSSFDLLRAARLAAGRAAEYLRGVTRPAGPEGWQVKEQRDFVTEVDRASETLIADALRQATPHGRIVGEELSPEVVRNGLVWIVDPLDGTTNFLHGVPIWAVSIAAAVDGVLEAGIVLDVPANEQFEAVRGHGASLAGKPLAVSTIAVPEFALIGTGFPFKNIERLDEYQRQFARVAGATSGIRRPGSAAIDLAWLAAGRFDGFWEQHLAPWDMAAGTLLVREAGGIVTDHAGNSDMLRHASLVGGNPAMHGWLSGVIREAATSGAAA
ncbi:MAG: inositol monophosphatase [Gemmatimonadetes bacterium]|nr:inositol monophosphatase [Gemmatimonadota bacterium]